MIYFHKDDNEEVQHIGRIHGDVILTKWMRLLEVLSYDTKSYLGHHGDEFTYKVKN